LVIKRSLLKVKPLNFNILGLINKGNREMMVFLVILAVSGALIVGALWGAKGNFPGWVQGNLLALAGGALML